MNHITKATRRLILAASLCAVGAVVGPIAAANAEYFVGKCQVQGNAKFGGEKLPFEKKTKLNYSFTSEVVEQEAGKEFAKGKAEFCEGTVYEKKGGAELAKGEFGPGAEATFVKGEGKLSCSESESTGETGKGKLYLKKGATEYKAEFTLKFVTTKFGELKLELYEPKAGGAKTGEGTASFTKPGGAEAKVRRALECVKSELTKLAFDAEFPPEFKGEEAVGE